MGKAGLAATNRSGGRRFPPRRALLHVAAAVAVALLGGCSAVLVPEPCSSPEVGFYPNCRPAGTALVGQAPDFDLVAMPAEVSLAPGERGSSSVYVRHTPTFAGLVTFSVRAPGGVTATLNNSFAIAPFNRMSLFLQTESFLAPGRYAVTVTGQSIVSGRPAQERAVTIDVVVPRPFLPRTGYALALSDGTVHTYSMTNHGDVANAGRRVVAMATAPREEGYWLLTDDGEVHPFGSLRSHGSLRQQRTNAPVIGIEATPSGGGYWILGEDGGIFTFGDAQFLGSTGGMRLNQPIVAMEATPTGQGYWLVASDGGVFTFGDARFHGSTGGMKLDQPIRDLSSAPGGYRLLGADGGVFTFGTGVEFHGSGVGRLAGRGLAISTTNAGDGYWIADTAGTVIAFGGARFHGDLTFVRPPSPTAAFERVRE